MKAKKICVVIPAFNEEESLPSVITLINKLNYFNQHVVVVNDGSIDETGRIAKELKVTVINHNKNMGIGAALLSGIKYAKANGFDYVVELDADGQHNPKDIKRLLSELKTNDVVIGSRFIKKTNYKTTFFRKYAIYFIRNLIRVCTGKVIYDPTSGFRAYNKKVILYLSSGGNFDSIEPVSLVKILNYNFKLKELSVYMKKRQAGKSSMTPIRSFCLFWVIVLMIIYYAFKTKD